MLFIMWAQVFAILLFNGAVRCDCPWRECKSYDDYVDDEYSMLKNISYQMDQALLYARFHNSNPSVNVPGFHEELPGVYFLFEWLPLKVKWNLTYGYLYWEPNYNILRRPRIDHERYDAESYDEIYMKICTLKSDKGVLIKKSLEGSLHFDDLQEGLQGSSFEFPHKTWEINTPQIAHYKFAFSFTIDYNSTFCELANIQWTLAEGSYVIEEPFPSYLFDLKHLFRFKIPEEHMRMIKEQIHLMFDEQVVTALCTRFRPD